VDARTQRKWDRAAATFDLMSAFGPELRWQPAKRLLFSQMKPGADILFVALGTGLDIPCFPPRRTITAIDISPRMIERARKRVAAYEGTLSALVVDVGEMPFGDGRFDQAFTSCTLCSVPTPIEALREIRRVLKPGGELHMFEHTGSRWFPFSLMMKAMTPLTRAIGPEMDRDTTGNVRAAGFEIEAVRHVFLDVVKTIHARKPPPSRL
jgi:ubiquinone/menaquinone biosynthesis C-methylase UbiE